MKTLAIYMLFSLLGCFYAQDKNSSNKNPNGVTTSASGSGLMVPDYIELSGKQKKVLNDLARKIDSTKGEKKPLVIVNNNQNRFPIESSTINESVPLSHFSKNMLLVLALLISVIFVILIYRNLQKRKKTSSKVNKRNRMIFNTLSLTMKTEQIYVLSLIVGSMFCILLGYLFAEVQYFTGGGKRVFVETDYIRKEFNIVVGLISFLIASGVTYLILIKNQVK